MCIRDSSKSKAKQNADFEYRIWEWEMGNWEMGMGIHTYSQKVESLRLAHLLQVLHGLDSR